MARTKAYFVKKARKDIYENGVSFKNKRGFSTTNLSLPADKHDQIVVKKGESYWWWKWRFGTKHISKTEPESSQLSRYGKSEWDERMEDFEGRKDDFENKDTLLTDIEEYKSELESRLENIPEPLQESSILNERIEELGTLYDEVEMLDGTENDEEE